MAERKVTDEQIFKVLQKEPSLPKAHLKLGIGYDALYDRVHRMGLRKVVRWEKR